MKQSSHNRLFALGCIGGVCGALAVLSCDSKHHEKPYTPFGVASSSGVASATAAPVTPPKPPFSPEKSTPAPPNAHEWTFAGRPLRARDGFVFERGLAADFTGDGKPDVVAWLVAAADTGSKPSGAVAPIPGELWLYADGAEPRRVATVPGFVPSGPGCKQRARLTRTGIETVTLDVRARCDAPLLPRSPVRAVSVLAPGRDTPQVFTLRLARDGGSKDLRFRVSSEDRDGDGRDDVALSVAIKNKSKEDEASIRFVWFDRKAGISRDASFPTRDFADLGSIEVVRAPGKTTSLGAIERVIAARRLFGAACAESTVSLLSDQDGNQFACNLSADAIAAFAEAEVRAELAQGSIGGAISALARAGWYGGALDEKTYQTLSTEIQKTTTVKPLRYLATPNASPRQASSMPRYSPLTFTKEGALLIQTVEGVVKVNPETGEETDVSEEIEPWPLTVISPSGQRLLGVDYPCDGPFITLSVSSATGQALPPLLTPLLAPRPGACGSKHKMFVELGLRPVAWNAEGFSAFLGTTELGPGNAEPKEGAARSENGRFAVMSTSLGILVLGGERPALWRNPQDEQVGLADCVIDDTGRYVACALGEHAQVLTADH